MKVSYALPKTRLTNEELAKLYPGWTEDKIFNKTGIASRFVTSQGETVLDLAEAAANNLFEEHDINASSIDYILLCTQSADYKLPTTACILQDRLGIPKSAGALDFNLGCSGFVYGLSLAKGLVKGGIAKRVLLVTSETYSKYIHPMDKSVRTIFGDGAAAMLVDEAAVSGIGEFVLGTDGSGYKNLIVPTGGAREVFDPTAAEMLDASNNVRTKNHLFMDGMEIFNFTLKIVPDTLTEVLSKNGVSRDDVGLYVFHQANKFMLDTLRRANLIAKDKFYVNMSDTGNTVSSSIPIALARAASEGRLTPGMKVVVIGFGVGLSWGAAVLTW